MAGWRRRCGRYWLVTTSTPRSASRRATGMIGLPGRRWSTRWSATRTRRCWCWMGGSWPVRWRRRRSCWRWSPAKTSSRARTGCSGSRGGWAEIDDLLDESDRADQADAAARDVKPEPDNDNDNDGDGTVDGDGVDGDGVDGDSGEDADPVTVFGDSAYADGATLDKLAGA